MTVVSLAEQIACVERELSLRQRVYPRWVVDGRMTQIKASAEIRAMNAVLDTLRRQYRAESAAPSDHMPPAA